MKKKDLALAFPAYKINAEEIFLAVALSVSPGYSFDYILILLRTQNKFIDCARSKHRFGQVVKIEYI